MEKRTPINIKITNERRGLIVVVRCVNSDGLVAIINIKNKIVSNSFLKKLINLDYLSLGVPKNSLVTNVLASNIYNHINNITSNMYMKKKWSVSFNI